VYAAFAWLGEECHSAVVNVGSRPTFDDGRGLIIEAHLLEFNGSLYGERMALDFVARIRAERKFDHEQALSVQIKADMNSARELLANSKKQWYKVEQPAC
jgi:riboflavin kinase/FMN adenylyltransferase